MRRMVVIVGAALAVAGASWLAWLAWCAMTRSAISAVLSALPPRLARWADVLTRASSSTAPSDYPGGVLAWAVLGAAVIDQESRGGNALTPPGDWNGTGDSGHGHTPWQIDDRAHGAYLARTDRTPATDSIYALGILASGWRAGLGLDPDARVRAALASYNAGPRAVSAALAGRDPDAYTTRHAYAAETLARLEKLS